MKILGVHPGWWPRTERGGDGFAQHDAAAVLVDDGVVVAAVEEERFDRVKHSNFFPVDAIRWVLEAGGTSLAEVDRVAVNLSRAAAGELGGGAGPPWLGGLFARTLGVDVTDRLAWCHHHLAHVASAYYPSGFARAVAVSLDGDGEGLSGMIVRADHGRFTPVAAYPAAASIGNFYQAAIGFLGYRRFDEYKVMGLAPYGDPARLRAVFARAYQLGADGGYTLSAAALGPALAAAGLTRARRRGEPIEAVHHDYAAALQETLEILVLHVIEHAARATGERALCYAGGVAHNAVANGRILGSGRFDDVFVAGAAHDGGGALGAALWTWHQARPGPGRPVSLCAGPALGSDDQIGARLAAWRPAIAFTRVDDIAAHAARALAAGRVIGWAQGRAELGPRALGHRSILADPRPREHRAIINAMIKKREAYRPFAPIVLAADAADYFELPATRANLGDMVYVVPVRPAWRERLGAITHVDGSARIQTVAPADDPLLARLLAGFAAATGLPILLNTSFNNDREPIVTSVDDAVTCFLTTGLHALAIGPYWVERDAPPATVIGGWRVDLRGDQRLVDGEAIESNAAEHFVVRRHPVSAALHAALASSDDRTLAERVGADLAARLAPEVLGLWDRRALRVAPR